MKKILIAVSLFLVGSLVSAVEPQFPGQEDDVEAAVGAESQETLLACFNAALAKGSFVGVQSVVERGYLVLGGDVEKVDRRWAKRMGSLFPILQDCSMDHPDDLSVDYVSELIVENNIRFEAMKALIADSLQSLNSAA